MDNISSIKTNVISPGFTAARNNVKTAATSHKRQTYHGKYRKIEFNEGLKILGNGFVKQLKDIASSIIEHPVKTFAMMGTITLGLMALPLAGIPTVVGGGVLALGFAGFAIGKGTYHAVQFARNNKEGSYNVARQNLEQIGEDSVDLALSLPFVPKTIPNIRNFAKYGKIGYNTNLVNELKTAKNKLATLLNTNRELARNVNYQSAVDRELAQLTSLSDSQKAVIKKELLDFNVPTNKIVEVVLDKWAQIKGIKTKPDVIYKTLSEGVGGEAHSKYCKIAINDCKSKIGTNGFSNYQQLKTELVNGKYEITYKELSTGNIIKESIDKQVLEAYENLYAQQRNLAPQSKRILTVVHEREHIHQYAQIFAQKGESWANPTPRAKQLYQNMVQEMPPITQNAAEIQKIEAYAAEISNGTPVSYIKNAREIGAREVERMALQDSNFQKLDKVFRRTNKINIPPASNTILANSLRTQGAEV